MSVRSRLLAEEEKQNSNSFLLCALVSPRTRQLMMTGNEYASTAQLVDLAINDLIAGALEFGLGKPKIPRLMQAESVDKESRSELESDGVPAVSATTLSAGAT